MDEGILLSTAMFRHHLMGEAMEALSKAIDTEEQRCHNWAE